MRVLNVGGGSRNLPERYNGWDQVLLDIDPAVNPDVCCDALEMHKLPANEYDAVYCSHTVEHFYQHDVPTVLAGFLHVLKDTGFADIAVPNLSHLFKSLMVSNLDINDVWYRTGQGLPITFHDVLYGWSQAMQKGNLFYAHKCGFTAHSLGTVLANVGFKSVQVAEQDANLFAFAHKNNPPKV
jgi:hypothetical protein